MWHILIPIIITVIIFAFFSVKYTYTHWSRNGIPQPPPSFPFGNVGPLLLKQDTFGLTFKKLYDYFKTRNQSFGGYYFVLKPELIIVDTELIKNVLTKDFAYFADRGVYIDEENDPLSAHLFSLPGAKWRVLRTKLTPTFTSGKMKIMFPTLLVCSEEMSSVLNEMIKEKEPIDIKDILQRFTIDVIGSCAFGIECNSIKNPDNEFRKYASQVLEVSGIDVIRQILAIAIPDIMKFFKIPGMNPKATNFFKSVVEDTVNFRETNNIVRNDFMHLLIEMKKKTSDKTNDKPLTLEQIAGQCFVFFIAGFETSSTTMSFCLFEMAMNEMIQDRVREEVVKVLEKYKGELTYEALMEMTYLDKVVNETLRKYPPLPFINREITIDYKLPNVEYIAKKGTPVVISVEGLHWDPEFYPEPEVFDPERFNEEEKQKRPHYSYLPFGEGPRICIGLRFGLMQTKVGLVEVIRNFKCSINEKTKIPLKMTTKNFLTAAEGGIWLNMNKI